MLDGPGTPAWQRRALEALEASSALSVGSVMLERTPRRGALARAHSGIERRLFRTGPDALAPDGVAARGAAQDGDLVVWLAEGPLPSEWPAGGLLHLRHAARREPADAAFRRAVLRGAKIVESEAVLARPDGSRSVVERTVSAARPYSATLSRDRALWKLAALVARAAARADRGGSEPAAPDAEGPAPTPVELMLRSPLRWLRILSARALFARPWRILVRARSADPSGGWTGCPELVAWRRGHAYADPVLFEHEGRHHLFCEEIPPDGWRAVISHAELAEGGGRAAAPEPVLEAPYHLSYPFVFAHGGEVFMIPETSSQQRVELYRARAFPRGWQHEATLLEGLSASDATVFEHVGRLWMFVNVAAPGATLLDELHLFSAERLHGPWEPHPANPVVSDVRAGRPAGPVLRRGAELIRPAQDGSRRYGGAVSLRRIDELTPEGYAEHEVGRIEPGAVGGRATHTYTADGRFEAVDLRRREPSLQALRALRRAARRP